MAPPRLRLSSATCEPSTAIIFSQTLVVVAAVLIIISQATSWSFVAYAASTGAHTCQPIHVELCKYNLGYEGTSMPNIFGDTRQEHADIRSHRFQALVESRCSPLIRMYACELLTPLCKPQMGGFKVYPCRSVCREIKRDCEKELSNMNKSLLVMPDDKSAFDCDMLPYESNGSIGGGPCHDFKQTPVQTDDMANKQLSESPVHNEIDVNPLLNVAPDSSYKQQPSTDNSKISPEHILRPDLIAKQRYLQNQHNFNRNNINRTHQTQKGNEVNSSSNNNNNDNNSWLNQVTSYVHATTFNNFFASCIATFSKYSSILSGVTILILLLYLFRKRLFNCGSKLKFSSFNFSSSSSSSSSNSTTNPYHYITYDQAVAHMRRQPTTISLPRPQHQPQSQYDQPHLFNNILLSSPNRKVLLLGQDCKHVLRDERNNSLL